MGGGTIFTLTLCLAIAGARHLHPVPLSHFRVRVSPEGELLHASGALVFAAVAQWMPPDGLALEAGVGGGRAGHIPGSHETVNNQRNSSWQIITPRALHG